MIINMLGIAGTYPTIGVCILADIKAFSSKPTYTMAAIAAVAAKYHDHLQERIAVPATRDELVPQATVECGRVS